MNQISTVSLLGGGVGSGCNPRAAKAKGGKCGRKKNSKVNVDAVLKKKFKLHTPATAKGNIVITESGKIFGGRDHTLMAQLIENNKDIEDPYGTFTDYKIVRGVIVSGEVNFTIYEKNKLTKQQASTLTDLVSLHSNKKIWIDSLESIGGSTSTEEAFKLINRISR